MLDVLEDTRNEFKEVLNEKLEKEIIGFLNNTGGNLYIGIDDDGNIIGVNEDSDKLQLLIKDRIKNNISPSTLGLFDIIIEEYNNKKIIHIVVASGNEKPYYLKRKGMTNEGCYIRVGSSTERMKEDNIIDLFSKRTRNSLRNIISPNQSLTFSQLKIYYEENGFNVNDNFISQLGLVMEDGKYNYIAYLLSDNNNISIKVATYSGNDSYDLIENEEYGYCSLIKATKKVIDKFNIINKTYSKITSSKRLETKMFDPVAVREIIVNAIVHNMWESEVSPKFEIFKDYISITSTGGLPRGLSKNEFLKGYSYPKHPDLMRIFKDLDLVEQLGTGIIRVLKVYKKEIYEITENFIRVNIYFNDNDMIISNEIDNEFKLNETQRRILMLIEENNSITQKEIIDSLVISRATVTKNLKVLKDNGYIERIGADKRGKWKILKEFK